MNKKTPDNDVSSLLHIHADKSLTRIKGLWRITSLLSAAYSKGTVGKIIVNEGFSLLEAHSGDILLLKPDNSYKVIAQKGYPKNFLSSWRKARPDSPLLTAEVIKSGKAYYIPDIKDLDPKYTVAKKFIETTGSKSAVLLPLKINRKIIGILQFTFIEAQLFSREDKFFMDTLAFQCAQALERVMAIEDLKKYNRQLQVMNKQKDDFISMASHELKTPLTSLSVFVDVLSRQLIVESSSKSIAYLGKVQTQVERLNMLVNDLLDMSRIKTGKLVLHPERLQLDKLVTDFVSDQQEIFKSHKFNVAAVPCVVIGDKLRIYQVMTNLITNAVKYSPEGSLITIMLETDAQSAVVSVTDEGTGISKADQANIFDRFYQVSDIQSNGASGLGMGLYISNQIVKTHGGRMWVKSKYKNGSTFYFSIPRT